MGEDYYSKEKEIKEEEERFLSLKVKTYDNGFGYIFTKREIFGSETRWRCHLCDVVVVSHDFVDTHIKSKKHQIKLSLPSHPVEMFQRVEKPVSGNEPAPDLQPGQPVPPGYEDVCKKETQIQVTLDAIAKPLVGLEYLVELAPEEVGNEPSYICMLCDKKGDPRVVISHLSSYNHCSKYISIHFPTAYRAMSNDFPNSKEGRKAKMEVINRLCAKIHEKFGRLDPIMMNKTKFDETKPEVLKKIVEGKHLRETEDCKLLEVVDKNILEQFLKAANENASTSADPDGDADAKSESGENSHNTSLSDKPKGSTSEKRSSLNQETSRGRSSSGDFREKRNDTTRNLSRSKSRSPSRTDIDRYGRSRRTGRSFEGGDRNNDFDRYGDRVGDYGRDRGPSDYGRDRGPSDYGRDRGPSDYGRDRDGDFRRDRPLPYRRDFDDRPLPYRRDFDDRPLPYRRDFDDRPLPYRRDFDGDRGRDYYGRDRIGDYIRDRILSGRDRDLLYDLKRDLDRGRNRDADRGREYERRGSERDRIRHKSRSRSRNRRSLSGERSRSASRGRRSRSPDHYKRSKKRETLKEKWEKFKEMSGKVEVNLNKQLEFHRKNPEKHPQYPEEWKKFWNKRYRELQAEGKDPSKHDFKPEWILFWNVRMQELHNEKLKRLKDEIREELSFTEEQEEYFMKKGSAVDVIELSPSPERKTRHTPEKRKRSITPEKKKRSLTPEKRKRSVTPERRRRSRTPEKRKHSRTPERRKFPERKTYPVAAEKTRPVTVNDIKNTWKELTGSDIKGRSPSPHKNFAYEPIRAISVLRLLTAMEQQLGSLGPKVNDLMSAAIAMEKVSPNSSDTILLNPSHLVLFETVTEKLKGQLYAGIVEKNMVTATKTCIVHLEELLNRADKMPQVSKAGLITSPVVRMQPASLINPMSAPTNPVEVPGIGIVDKAAIAQQIATALVAQGRTDVTQEELEQLINAVIGMAQANSQSEQPVSTAEYLAQLQKPPALHELPQKIETPIHRTAAAPPAMTKPPITRPETSASSALQLLRNAYDEGGITGRNAAMAPTVNNAAVNITPPIPMNKGILKTSSLRESISAANSPLKEKPVAFNSLLNNPVIGSNLPKQNLGMLKETPEVETTINKPQHKESVISPVKTGQNMKESSSKDDFGGELTDTDLKTLLSNFKELGSEQQHKLIIYLKKLEATEPDRVEKLRSFVSLDDKDTKQSSAGRLSPFSSRAGGINPSLDNRQEIEMEESDDDDDYSFEDIYAAASKKVAEKELENQRIKEMEEAKKNKEKEEEMKRIQKEEEVKRKQKEEEMRRQELENKLKREQAESKRKQEEEINKKELERLKLEKEKKDKEARMMQQEDLLRRTNAVIENIMGELPTKFSRVGSQAMDPQRNKSNVPATTSRSIPEAQRTGGTTHGYDTTVKPAGPSARTSAAPHGASTVPSTSAGTGASARPVGPSAHIPPNPSLTYPNTAANPYDMRTQSQDYMQPPMHSNLGHDQGYNNDMDYNNSYSDMGYGNYYPQDQYYNSTYPGQYPNQDYPGQSYNSQYSNQYY